MTKTGKTERENVILKAVDSLFARRAGAWARISLTYLLPNPRSVLATFEVAQ